MNYYRWELIEIDKDDNKVVGAYIASNANFLISKDKHSNVLKKIDFPYVNILNIDDFLDLITLKNHSTKAEDLRC